MGIGRTWTAEETTRLEELWGVKTIPQIAEILGRSKVAVAKKSERLSLGSFKDSSKYIPIRQAANLMGVDLRTIADYWIPKLGCPFKKIALRNSYEYRYIPFEKFISWLEKNQSVWDSRRLELHALGKEPAWLIQKRKKDFAGPQRQCLKWTAEDDLRLVTMFRRGGLTYGEMGKVLYRSEAAVAYRLTCLDIWGSGKPLGKDVIERRKTVRAVAKKKELLLTLCEALLKRRNKIAFDSYWQKEICVHWHDIKGCMAEETDCDSCVSFIRVRPQYCVRCGATFFERAKNLMCSRCRIARKKQAQKKWAALGGRRV